MKGDGGVLAGRRAVPTIVKSIDAHLEAAGRARRTAVGDGTAGGRPVRLGDKSVNSGRPKQEACQLHLHVVSNCKPSY